MSHRREDSFRVKSLQLFEEVKSETVTSTFDLISIAAKKKVFQGQFEKENHLQKAFFWVCLTRIDLGA